MGLKMFAVAGQSQCCLCLSYQFGSYCAEPLRQSGYRLAELVRDIGFGIANNYRGSDESIIAEVKQSLTGEKIEFEVQGVYGVYDIVLKISSDDADNLR